MKNNPTLLLLAAGVALALIGAQATALVTTSGPTVTVVGASATNAAAGESAGATFTARPAVPKLAVSSTTSVSDWQHLTD